MVKQYSTKFVTSTPIFTLVLKTKNLQPPRIGHELLKYQQKPLVQHLKKY